jgi:hypothetical protein
VRYPGVVEHVSDVLTALRARHGGVIPSKVWLSIDKTVVGAAVVDLFRRADPGDASLLAVLGECGPSHHAPTDSEQG